MTRIPSYNHFISPALLQRLINDSESVVGLDQLQIAQGLQSEFPHLETPEALKFSF